MKQKKFLTVKDMVLIAVFTALIVVCTYIQIPLGPVPFTLQTFAVFTAAGLLGVKRSTISVLVYILLGLIGLPVFSGAAGGPAVIAGPTGGYITGFIFTSIIIGLITTRFKNSNTWINMAVTIAAMIIGDTICFMIGTMQYMAVMKVSLAVALSYCVIPFIIPDLIKMVVATVFINRIKKELPII